MSTSETPPRAGGLLTLTAISRPEGGRDWSFDGQSGDVCTNGLERMLGVPWSEGAVVTFKVDQPPALGALECTWRSADYMAFLNNTQVTDSVEAALRGIGVDLAEPFSVVVAGPETLTFVRDYSEPDEDRDLGWEGPDGSVICPSHAQRLFGWDPEVPPGTPHTLTVSHTPVPGAVHIVVRSSDRCYAWINGAGIAVWRDLGQLVLDRGGEVWVCPGPAGVSA